jgi:hypothetical protein
MLPVICLLQDDYIRKMALYRDSYEPIEEEEGSFIKVSDSPRPCCPSHFLQPSFLAAVFVAAEWYSTALSCFALPSLTLQFGFHIRQPLR